MYLKCLQTTGKLIKILLIATRVKATVKDMTSLITQLKSNHVHGPPDTDDVGSQVNALQTAVDNVNLKTDSLASRFNYLCTVCSKALKAVESACFFCYSG